jgi:serine/threonine protein phosphatase 1
MAARTFAIGDIHGDLEHLEKLFAKLAKQAQLDKDDTIVFMGDYVDRGFYSRQVLDFVRVRAKELSPARVIALRGNHEDGWLRVIAGGWPEFVLPPGNGCLACLRSYSGQLYFPGDLPTEKELAAMMAGSFFPEEVVAWLKDLPYFYEDEHAIYVHAGLPKRNGAWVHPKAIDDPTILLWIRTSEFFNTYDGKRIVVGHTSTDCLPPELSMYTPEDPNDMWESEHVLAIDTGCGKGGFLTCVELPSKTVYESRG